MISRRRGRPRKAWKDNIKDWTGQSFLSVLHITEDRSQTITAEAFVGVLRVLSANIRPSTKVFNLGGVTVDKKLTVGLDDDH